MIVVDRYCRRSFFEPGIGKSRTRFLFVLVYVVWSVKISHLEYGEEYSVL
jgi:hypothetical protein